MTDSVAPLECRNTVAAEASELLRRTVTRTVHFVAPVSAVKNSVTSLLVVYALATVDAGELMRAAAWAVPFIAAVSTVVGVVASTAQ
jgi:hypothetical protein